MVKPSDRTVPWKFTSKLLSTLNQMNRPDSYQWLSLLTTMPRTWALIIRLSSWTVGTIFWCFMRKILTSALSLSQQISYRQHYKSWWPFPIKTSIMLRGFKINLTTKTLSQAATPLVTKFGWIVNISRPNATGSWRPSFSNCFKCYIQCANKPISLNY